MLSTTSWQVLRKEFAIFFAARWLRSEAMTLLMRNLYSPLVSRGLRALASSKSSFLSARLNQLQYFSIGFRSGERAGIGQDTAPILRICLRRRLYNNQRLPTARHESFRIETSSSSNQKPQRKTDSKTKRRSQAELTAVRVV